MGQHQGGTGADGVGGGKWGLHPCLTLIPCPESICPPVLNGSRLFEARRSEKVLTPDQAQEDVVPPYAAYAPSGSPQVWETPPFRVNSLPHEVNSPLGHRPLPWGVNSPVI